MTSLEASEGGGAQSPAQPQVPLSAYVDGYARARAIDRHAADNYVAHTRIGDPVMDAVVEDLAHLPQREVHKLIHAGMEEDHACLRDAPQSLRDFFIDAPQPDPDWLDRDALQPGIRAFQRNSVLVLSAFVTGVLIDGFSTLISKSFAMTGRIFENGVWRLKQNNRHQMEIFLPRGLERYGEGWKLSVRIRFVHAQIRRLLGRTAEWEHDAWGVPVSAAHLGYSVACFAARTVKHSESLGARYSTEERAGFHDVWRYAGYLMGIPETILFTDEAHALHMYRIGSICEPPPTEDAIVMTNALINSAPLVANITDLTERRKLVNNVIYPISRGLVGNDLADQLNFPRNRRSPFPLLAYRIDQRIQRLRAAFGKEGSQNFGTLLEASAYDAAGLSYRLPDHAHDERGGKW
ncbi:oxygenase MpaB family protein [Candidatus Palauibacter sp.]|uniref:oxygenase MpaB family protein n=1 Tax=Candidatus Palauibacter sp. TaxID=3101350 RepID=UPI003B020BD4